MLAGCGSGPESFSVAAPAKEMRSPAGNVSAVPYLSVDGAGTVLLSWVESVGKQGILYYSALKQEAWSAPVRIAAGPRWYVNWADVPAVAGNGKGDMVASFLVKNGTSGYGYNLHLVQSRDFGESWSESLIPHDDRSQTEHGFVSMMPMDDGRFFVVWLDGRNNTQQARKSGGSQSMWAAFIDQSATLIHQGAVDWRVCDCCQPSAVRTQDGPVVVYRDRSAKEIRDIAIMRWGNGRWEGPSPVSHDNWEIHGCPVDGPKADVLESTLAVTWFTAAQGKPRVQVVFSDDHGRTFGDPMRVDNGRAVGRADIVLLDRNTAVVSWLELTDGHEEIRIKKVFKSGAGEESRVISGIAQSSGFPQLTKGNGKIYLAWADGDRVRTAVMRP